MIVNELHLLFPHIPFRLLIACQIYLERNEHSKDLLLVDFHPPPYCIAYRMCIFLRSINVLLSAQEEPGALRSAQAFSSGKAYEIKPHFRELPQVFGWRYIRCAIDERGNTRLLRNGNEFLPLHLAFIVIRVEKPHQGGVVVDGCL